MIEEYVRGVKVYRFDDNTSAYETNNRPREFVAAGPTALTALSRAISIAELSNIDPAVVTATVSYDKDSDDYYAHLFVDA